MNFLKIFIFYITLHIGAFCFGRDVHIAVIDGKLVKVENILNPQVEIVGAEDAVPLGELVVLQARLKEHLPNFIKEIKYTWEIDKKRFIEDDDKVFFGAGIKPTTFKVGVSVVLTYQVDSELVVQITKSSVSVKVGDDVAPIPPEPPPQPTYNENTQFIISSLSPIKDKVGYKNVMNALSKTTELIAKRATSFPDAKSLLYEWKMKNTETLTNLGYSPNYLDVANFGPLSNDYLWKLYNDRKLSTLKDYEILLYDFSKGFEVLSQ